MLPAPQTRQFCHSPLRNGIDRRSCFWEQPANSSFDAYASAGGRVSRAGRSNAPTGSWGQPFFPPESLMFTSDPISVDPMSVVCDPIGSELSAGSDPITMTPGRISSGSVPSMSDPICGFDGSGVSHQSPWIRRCHRFDHGIETCRGPSCPAFVSGQSPSSHCIEPIASNRSSYLLT